MNQEDVAGARVATELATRRTCRRGGDVTVSTVVRRARLKLKIRSLQEPQAKKKTKKKAILHKLARSLGAPVRRSRAHHCSKLEAVCPGAVHPHLELAERANEPVNWVPDYGKHTGRLGAVRAAGERDLETRIGHDIGSQARTTKRPTIIDHGRQAKKCLQNI